MMPMQKMRSFVESPAISPYLQGYGLAIRSFAGRLRTRDLTMYSSYGQDTCSGYGHTAMSPYLSTSTLT